MDVTRLVDALDAEERAALMAALVEAEGLTDDVAEEESGCCGGASRRRMGRPTMQEAHHRCCAKG